MQADQIFDFRNRPLQQQSARAGASHSQEGPTLLLLDRRDDPVTPL